MTTRRKLSTKSKAVLCGSSKATKDESTASIDKLIKDAAVNPYTQSLASKYMPQRATTSQIRVFEVAEEKIGLDVKTPHFKFNGNKALELYADGKLTNSLVKSATQLKKEMLFTKKQLIRSTTPSLMQLPDIPVSAEPH